MDEQLKNAILHKVKKLGCNIDGDFIRYNRRLYWVNIRLEKVVEQKEYK